MTELQSYKGKSVGDAIKFNSDSYPALHTGKIIKIFKQLNEIYVEVRVRGGSVINLPISSVTLYEEKKLCNCEMVVLMRSGCQCGGK